jgi:hypothetical protein
MKQRWLTIGPFASLQQWMTGEATLTLSQRLVLLNTKPKKTQCQHNQSKHHTVSTNACEYLLQSLNLSVNILRRAERSDQSRQSRKIVDTGHRVEVFVLNKDQLL